MLPEKLMEDLLYLADEILIEADGSAHMPVKAPAEHEPVLFPYMDEVVIVMGTHAIGKPLREVCHRVDYAKELLKCDADKIVTGIRDSNSETISMDENFESNWKRY